ncbi:MAG: CoA ester lyase [Ectothiorhodospiraceae bacterium]|nr:CoA ester lyase [Ectothiorhodospiraceae bacterium]
MSVWLFVPGHQPDRVRKAAASSADFVVVDWEDAVSPDRKAEARQATREVLAELATPERFGVRINPGETDAHGDDLQALPAVKASMVVVAKVDDPDHLSRVAAFNRPLIPLIESAIGLEKVLETARAPLVNGLAFGYIDFLADIDATETRETLLYARSKLVIAARVAGLTHLLDGVFAHLDDEPGLEEEVRHVRALGFNGKLAIHPKQIDPIRKHLQPTEEQIAWARDVVRIYDEALSEGRGAFKHKGQMIDVAVVRRAERILGMAGRP